MVLTSVELNSDTAVYLKIEQDLGMLLPMEMELQIPLPMEMDLKRTIPFPLKGDQWKAMPTPMALKKVTPYI